MRNATDTVPESNTQPDGPVTQMIAEGGVASEVFGPQTSATPLTESGAQQVIDSALPEGLAPGKRGTVPQSTWSWSSPFDTRMNKWWTKLAYLALDRFGEASSGGSPDVLEKAFRRARLAEDLLDDFKQGSYSQISKRSVAVMGSGLALASVFAKPSVPAVTRFGSACISLLVTEISREELLRYCRFKNYELQDYFG